MNIALLGPAHPWRGGIAHYNACLYKALHAAGHTPTLINFKALYPEALFPGKTQKDTSQSPFEVPCHTLYHPLNPATWATCARYLKEHRIDRLVLQWWHPYFAPGYAALCALARTLGIQTTMICHNVRPHEASPVDDLLLRLAYAFPDRFITQSTTEAARLRDLIGPTRHIDVVPHPPYDVFQDLTTPLDRTAARTAARKTWNITAPHALLFFGLVRTYKGLHTLIDAAALLPPDLDWQLLVAGEFYDPIEEYQQRIERQGLTHRITLHDRYVANEEVAPLFTAADLCVLPYHHATGSGIANIARTFDLPLIMSDLPPLREAFEGEDIAWTPPKDAAALSAAIVDVLEKQKKSPTPRRHHETSPQPPQNATWTHLAQVISAD